MATPTIIRFVTEALLQILQTDLAAILPQANIVAAPPETVAKVTGQTLIVYLYQVLESPFLKNSGQTNTLSTPNPPSPQGVTIQQDPLALDLYYLLIPFSTENNYLDTYDILGAAMNSFHDHGTFSPGSLGVTGLAPEETNLEFHLTLNPLSTSDLLRLWEAVNEPYRLSVAYVVRTVKIDSTIQATGQLVSKRQLTVAQKRRSTTS
jgi:Pvc16 N-terminal domain